MGLRVLARIGQLHPGCAVLLVAVLARPARATELGLAVSCELSPDQRQELDARVRLLVHGAPPPAPESISIICGDTSGRVTLHFADHDRSQPIASDEQHVEQMLVAVEELLAERPTRPEARSNAPESTPAPARNSTPATTSETQALEVGVESDARAGDVPPARRSTRTIGGAGLGVGVERWPDPAGLAVGPRLDFAWGAGSWAATSFESVRFGATPETRLLAFDALVGVAWGAPFAPTRAGAVLAVGGEWFSAAASSDPTGQRTSSSFIVDLGLRWGETLGSGALWLGADGRFRVRPPELPEPVMASLGRWSVIISLGGALTVR
ncbi:MAG TPA: hypothetical protein VFU02_03655 [Polyangiaceae bacterium]|nr:hypothetical protein [Polyangiaceae bacterium]